MLPNSGAAYATKYRTPRPTVRRGGVVVAPDHDGRTTGHRHLLDRGLLGVDIGRVVEPSSVLAPGGPHAALDEHAGPPAVGTDDPQLRKLAVHDVDDRIPGRRPLGHADGDGWIALERDLPGPRAVGADHPQVGVSAVVGQVDELRAVGADRRCLHLTGLPRHRRHRLRILDSRSGDRALPDVRLAANPADHESAGLVDVGLDKRHVAGCDLRIRRSIHADHAQIERRRVRQCASLRRAVDEARAIWKPRHSSHERRPRHRPALAAAGRNDPQHLVPDRGTSTLKREPRVIRRPAGRLPGVAARHFGHWLRIRAVARDGRQDHTTLVGAKERNAPAVVTDVAAAESADDRPGQSAEG